MSLVFISGSSDGLGLLAARLLVEGPSGDAARAQRRARRGHPALAAEARAVVIGDLSSIVEMRRVADQASERWAGMTR